MRIAKKAALMLVIVLVGLYSQAFAEISLTFGGCDTKREEYQRFVEAHPEVTVHAASNIYLSTTEIVNAFLTGEFAFDTFVMTTSSFDMQQLMQKGYCGALSESPVICEQLAEMYTPIQQQVLSQETIYGVPFSCYIGYYAYDPKAWEAAGLSEGDAPQSFTEYLDFLEQWIERIQMTPEDNISICNTFDAEQYGKYSYVSYLTDLLVKNHIMQCNFLGEPLRFDTPIFRELLTRCETLGQALYAYEPAAKGDMALFVEAHGMRELAYLVPLRLTNDQPVLIKATLYAAFQNIRCNYPELAREYLENCITCIPPETGAYLYCDAEPVENPDYKQSMDSLLEEIERLKKRLAEDTSMSPIDQRAMQDQIAEKTQAWDAMAASEERYLISPNDLQLYRMYGENLYFQKPSIFDPSTEDGKNMKQLRDRFSSGGMSVEQFVKELDQLAWMLEMEAGI